MSERFKVLGYLGDEPNSNPLDLAADLDHIGLSLIYEENAEREGMWMVADYSFGGEDE